MCRHEWRRTGAATASGRLSVRRCRRRVGAGVGSVGARVGRSGSVARSARRGLGSLGAGSVGVGSLGRGIGRSGDGRCRDSGVGVATGGMPAPTMPTATTIAPARTRARRTGPSRRRVSRSHCAGRRFRAGVEWALYVCLAERRRRTSRRAPAVTRRTLLDRPGRAGSSSRGRIIGSGRRCARPSNPMRGLAAISSASAGACGNGESTGVQRDGAARARVRFTEFRSHDDPMLLAWARFRGDARRRTDSGAAKVRPVPTVDRGVGPVATAGHEQSRARRAASCSTPGSRSAHDARRAAAEQHPTRSRSSTSPGRATARAGG